MNIQKLTSFLKTATGKLTISYLIIIMIMSIGFSFVFYTTSYSALGRQLPPPNVFELRSRPEIVGSNQTIEDFFRARIEEGRRELLFRLVGLNLLILAGGSALSYYLARRTLRPIEENMEAQSQFVSDASHELRTPLTVLQTTNEVALRKSKFSVSEAKDVFQHNVEEVTKLKQLTDSLLNLAKTDNGNLEFAQIDISDVVSGALNRVVNTALEKNITVDDQVSKISIRGNKVCLSQVLTIVLDNAIKYSPAGSNIQITARADTKFVFLSVKDEGIGIKAVHLPHIFDRFYRADSSRSKHTVEGFGIGLALAKKIIDQHNGAIIVASTPGKGSTFTLKLPLS